LIPIKKASTFLSILNFREPPGVHERPPPTKKLMGRSQPSRAAFEMTLVNGDYAARVRIVGLNPLRAKAASRNHAAFLFTEVIAFSASFGFVPALCFVSCLVGWLGCHNRSKDT
jgi:hypothetical protein